MRFSLKFLILFAIFTAHATTGFAALEKIDPTLLENKIATNRSRVAEFKWLAEWGKANGVRVYIAGGSAVGFAQYIKDFEIDQARIKAGLEPLNFQTRFHFNYYDIFRSTQDADIIIDASEEMAQKLEAELAEKFKYMQGSKTIWEVRLLKTGRGPIGTAGYKDSLLSEDFLNQNSDSYSTGLIEMTDPKDFHSNDESVVRDLFDWKNKKDCRFLHDLAEGKVTFYHNDKHFTTKRAMAGLNPEILSVERILTKAFQYDADLRSEDLPAIQKIIDEFDPKEISKSANSYVQSQIIKNGMKIYQHSQDLERSKKILDELHLREKLIQFGDANLSLWMNKKPLPSFKVGQGTGKTAKELGLDVVAHETNSFQAFESITMSRRGHPNIFESRDGIDGEAAVHGNGTYTKIGREGARGTGLTIRFKVDPNAIEGVDFFIPEKAKEFVVFKNRNALKVIDETVTMTPVDYFRFLVDQPFDASDKGTLEKIKLKVSAQFGQLSKKEIEEIFQFSVAAIERTALREFLNLSLAADYPPAIEYLKKAIDKDDRFFLSQVLRGPHWNKRPELMQMLINKNETFMDNEAIELLGCETWKNHPEFVEQLLSRAEPEYGLIAREILSKPFSEKHPEWMREIITNTKFMAHTFLVEVALSKPHWANHSEFVEIILKAGKADHSIAAYLLREPAWGKNKNWSKWVKQLLDKNDPGIQPLLADTMRNPASIHHLDLVKQLTQSKSKKVAEGLIRTFRSPQWTDHPEVILDLIKYQFPEKPFAYENQELIHLLQGDHWRKHPKLLEWGGKPYVSIADLREYAQKHALTCDKLLKKH